MSKHFLCKIVVYAFKYDEQNTNKQLMLVHIKLN